MGSSPKCEHFCSSDTVDPCVHYSDNDDSSVTLFHTWKPGSSESCICLIDSKKQDFTYWSAFTRNRTITLRARVDNGDLQPVSLSSTSLLTTDFIEIVFSAPPVDGATTETSQLFIEALNDFKISCRQGTASTTTFRPTSATIGQTSTTSRTSSPGYCYPRNRTIIIAAFRNIEEENLPGCYGRSCSPKEGYTDRDCVYSGGRCRQVASASHLLWMYGNCFRDTSHTSAYQNGCHHPSKTKYYALDCVNGEVVDPCEGVDVEVSRVSMVHSWSSDDPHVNCTCNVQSARKQPFNVTGLNVYQQNRSVLLSTLEFAGQSIRHSLFPRYTHRIYSNAFQITFEVRPSTAFRESHQPVAYQFLTLHAKEPFRLTCSSPSGTPPQTRSTTYSTRTPSATTPATSSSRKVSTVQSTNGGRQTPRIPNTSPRPTEPPKTVTTEEGVTPESDDDAPNVTIPIAAVVAGLGLLLVIAIVAGCLVRRRKRIIERMSPRPAANTYAVFPRYAASAFTDPHTVNNAYAIAQPLDSSVALLDVTSGVAGNGPTAREGTYTEVDLSDNPQHLLNPAQPSRNESNTYGALHHGGGQPLAGTSDSGAIYSHTTSSDIYNVLQRQPEKRVVVDNIYNTTNV